MLFKNPWILYGLLFLLVPIIVHLFQLRKFKKVPFSNVAFLRPLVTQTRKSRTLKKWLTLITRLLAIGCLVLAFTQPFLKDDTSNNLESDLVVYLDNSFSMQATGSNGKLYQNAVNDLIEKLPADLNFSLFTNNQEFKAVTKQEIANELTRARASAEQLTPSQVLLKAAALRSSKGDASSLTWISDFQKIQDDKFPVLPTEWNARMIKLEPLEAQNVSIDSAYISNESNGDRYISVDLSSNFDTAKPITLSFYNNEVLLSKTAVALENRKGAARFEIQRETDIDGYVKIEDKGLSFDNQLFISTNSAPNIKVLHINDSKSDFLKRIYTKDKFDYISYPSSQLNYNLIKEHQIIILNEVPNISGALAAELTKFTNAGNTLVVIPPVKGTGYNLLQGMGELSSSFVEKRITQINFDHPLLADVFSQRVTNFQYPKVNSTSFSPSAKKAILSYEDNSSFLFEIGKTYVFTAALNESNSNFQNSPLVVPVFYKMGLRNSGNERLYYLLGTDNEIDISASLDQDEVLELSLEERSVIPQQRVYESFVTLQTGQELSIEGTYDLINDDQKLGQLSFNSPRTENRLMYFTNSELGDNTILESVSEFSEELAESTSQTSLWKYFIAAALLFLFLELLILKFLK